MKRYYGMLVFLLAGAMAMAQSAPQSVSVSPRVSTSPVESDADDPAIWIHPTDPSRSVVIGTDKAGGNSGLYVWDMNGRQIQYVELRNPNNVDVRQGVRFGGETMDIVVTNLRPVRELRVFRVDPATSKLVDITTAEGIKTPELDTPYGLCLYHRLSDGAVFVIMSSKTGDNDNLYQYRLEPDGNGKIRGRFVGKFGNNRIKSVVEGLVADDELGYVYACDEGEAIRKFYADRDTGIDDQITAFGEKDGISGDREGIAIYKCSNGKGYILVSSQGNSTVKVYRREGDDGDPTRHSLLLTIDTKGSKETDGLDVTSHAAGPQFPNGFLVTHDSPGKRFNLYAWEEIAGDFLTICPNGDMLSDVPEAPNTPPATFTLEQNYPNPFNPQTTIIFTVGQAEEVNLRIYNILGQPIRTLIQGSLSAGRHQVIWDGRDDQGRLVPGGTYFYQLSVGHHQQTRRLLFLK